MVKSLFLNLFCLPEIFLKQNTEKTETIAQHLIFQNDAFHSEKPQATGKEGKTDKMRTSL